MRGARAAMRGEGRRPTCGISGGDGALEELVLLAQDLDGAVGLALALGGRGLDRWKGQGRVGMDQRQSEQSEGSSDAK